MVSNALNVCLLKAYLHSMNVIHRDLNSYNCLVREVSIKKKQIYNLE